jgi:hypothetical protein
MANYVIGRRRNRDSARLEAPCRTAVPDLDRRQPEHGQQAVVLSSQGGARTWLVAKRGLGEQEAQLLVRVVQHRLPPPAGADTPLARSTSSGRPRKGGSAALHAVGTATPGMVEAFDVRARDADQPMDIGAGSGSLAS